MSPVSTTDIGYARLEDSKPALKISACDPSTRAIAQSDKPVKDEFMLATGGVDFPPMPRFTNLYKKRQWQLEHMAGAFRVFARKGYTEGTAGHISVRDPVDPATFWINPSVNDYVIAR